MCPQIEIRCAVYTPGNSQVRGIPQHMRKKINIYEKKHRQIWWKFGLCYKSISFNFRAWVKCLKLAFKSFLHKKKIPSTQCVRFFHKEGRRYPWVGREVLYLQITELRMNTRLHGTHPNGGTVAEVLMVLVGQCVV